MTEALLAKDGLPFNHRHTNTIALKYEDAAREAAAIPTDTLRQAANKLPDIFK